MMTVDEPGVFDMPAADYHADPCPEPSLNRGCAVDILEHSPLFAAIRHPRLAAKFGEEIHQSDASTSMRFGAVAHELLCNQKGGVAVIDAPDFRTKAAREQKTAAITAGQIPVLQAVFDDAKRMVGVLKSELANHSDARLHIAFTSSDGVCEASVVDHSGGIWRRCRVDWMNNSAELIVDYKTTDQTLSDDFIRRQLVYSGLDVQAALYRQIVGSVAGTKPDFLLIWQETFPPYDWRVIKPSNTFEVIGAKKVDFAAKQFVNLLAMADGIMAGRPAGYDKTPAIIEPWPSYEANWLGREIAADDAQRQAVRDNPAPGGLHPLQAG